MEMPEYTGVEMHNMSFQHLKWLVIAAPLLVVLVLQYSRWALGPLMSDWRGRLLIDAVVLVGAVFFYAAVSRIITDLMNRLEQQNRELTALRSASLDIIADLSLEGVLQKIVDQARILLGCKFGALAVYDLDGRLESFVFSGIDAATREKIGDLPTGKGLLHLPLQDGQTLRFRDLTSHTLFCGFPPHHPAMHSLLAVPVICRQPFRGNLYLSEKIDGSEFAQTEEDILHSFAVQAAIAVDNAQLHAKVASLAVIEERLHLAREMHDGQAQVLAYVNTKAQVVEHLLDAGNIDQAREHLGQMADAAREVYADVREGILGLRSAADHDHNLALVLREFGHKWQDLSRIVLRLEVEGEARYDREAELHVLRVAQEALANVRKHSKAAEAHLRARLLPGDLSLEVEDDGIGFEIDEQQPHASTLERFGLSTMQERCEAIGADLEIRSGQGRGTLIRLAYKPQHLPHHIAGGPHRTIS
jgi:nitrate/nitrite-specific signal transduction histidine kinase